MSKNNVEYSVTPDLTVDVDFRSIPLIFIVCYVLFNLLYCVCVLTFLGYILPPILNT